MTSCSRWYGACVWNFGRRSQYSFGSTRLVNDIPIPVIVLVRRHGGRLCDERNCCGRTAAVHHEYEIKS